MADAKTLFSLSLRDEASKQLKTFEGNYRRTLGNVQSTTDSGQGMATLVADVGSLEGVMSMLGATAPQVALAMGALNAAGTAVDWGRQAAAVDAMEKSFNRLAAGVGTSGASMLSAIRTASSGMISDQELMLAANTAMALGVVRNTEQMTGLLQVAIAKGAELGVEPTKAFADLVNGLGRMSPEILNNIGVVVDADAAYKTYAASINTTVDKLNDQQKMTALVNAVMAANPDAAAQAAAAGDSAAAAFGRWDTATKQFSETWGRVFLPAIAGGLDLVTRFINAVGGIGDVMAGKINLTPEQIDAKIAEQQAMISQYKDPNLYFPSDAVNGSIAQAEDQIRMLEQAKRILTSTAIGTAAAVNNVGTAADNAAAGERNAALAALSLKQNLADVAMQSRNTGSALQSMWLSAAGALGGAAALAGYEEQRKQLDSLRQAWVVSGRTNSEMKFLEQEWLDKNNAKLQKQIDLVNDVGTAAGHAESGFNSLQSTIQGIIDQSMSLDVSWPGKDQAAAGGDAINENARRLAAIANENLIGQPWMEEFKAEAPGTYADLMLKIASGMNPQAAAQQLMREFQAGLRPELLDKGMIKDRVKQMLLGDANSAALAQEIASELATEMNISVPEALAATKSAMGIGQESNGSVASSLLDGTTKEMNDNNFGKQLGDVAISSLKSADAIAAWTRAGESAWYIFKAGFDGAASGSSFLPPGAGGASGTPTEKTGGNSINITINGVSTTLTEVASAARAGVLDAQRAKGRI